MKKLVISVVLFATCVLGAVAAKTPKYIFYFIGDGMGLGHIMATQNYNRYVINENTQLTMTSFPVASVAMTYSYSSPVTDSAAAGTALSTGFKTRNGMLGMNPDSVAVTSIAKYLNDKGYGVGIVTSVAIDDATPGAFYAHVPSRSHFDNIAANLASSNYNFFAGASLRGKKGAVETVIESGGYKIYHGMDAYNASEKSGKTLILNPKEIDSSNIGYTIDSIKGALNLPDLTKAAIEHLEKDSPKKFFLMVEGGNIDWAAHANDPGAVIKEIINFDQAIKLAYEFYLAHKDETLIVVTADHDTGGMALQQNNKALYEYIDCQRMSKQVFMDECTQMLKSNKVPTWEEMKQFIKDNTGLFGKIPVNENESAKLESAFTEVFVNHDTKEYKTLYDSFNGFVVKVFNLLNKKDKIGWITGSHTGNFVPVYSVGVGSDMFKTLNNNIEIPRKIATLTGVTMP